MRQIITLIIFLGYNSLLLAQSDMERNCAKTIRNNSKDILFPKFNEKITVKKDTIHFDNSVIVLKHSSPAAITILKQGLLFPALIVAAGTGGDGKFEMSTLPYIGLLSISSFEELKLTDTIPTVKTFSFLLWRSGIANPSLYIFQLTNESSNSKTSIDEFIKNARLTAFGFCSILI